MQTTAPIEIVEEGWVCQRSQGPAPIAVTSRLAMNDSGELLCSYLLQSKLAVNDFLPVLSRSSDHGRTWSDAEPIWPQLGSRYSISVSISRAPDRRLYLFGSRFTIDEPGETIWCDATQGLKANELIWSESTDGGRTWPEPRVIPMAIPGSAEAPGPMCVTRGGRWLACYAPYNTFDPALKVDRSQVALMSSDDRGATWQYRPMLRFVEPDSTAAEAWVVELVGGRLVGTSWQMDMSAGRDHPNAYAVSDDGGATWSPTRSTGLQAQTTALTPLPDGDVLLIHNRRREDPPGIWICRAAPDADDFNVRWQAPLWSAATSGASDHAQWGSFSFGEPAVAPAGDGSFLLVYWCIEPIGSGIRFLRFHLT